MLKKYSMETRVVAAMLEGPGGLWDICFRSLEEAVSEAVESAGVSFIFSEVVPLLSA